MPDQGPLALLRGRRPVDHVAVYSDHHGLELLSVEECVELLCSKTVGRVGLSASSLPFVLPVRYVVDGGSILLRTGRGTRMAAATKDAVVAFQVDEFDDDLDVGWSVLVQGFARRMDDGARVGPAAQRILSSWVGPVPSECFTIPMEIVSGQRLCIAGDEWAGRDSADCSFARGPT